MNPTRRALLKFSFALPVLGMVPLVPSLVMAQNDERLPLVIHTSQGPHRLSVEVAETPAQRQRGLMERDHLDVDSGMLFLYDRQQSGRQGFWMYRTRIPLDIAFIDSDGRIVAIEQMPPCESLRPAQCPSYEPGEAYHSALEVNAGYFAERGINVGDCVSLPGHAGFCRT
ncbi:DUF192 domain-containing protein [Halomonas sp. Bachu 37]|uniref:DUF192 domain-containing protein n=1 Tax=Halomonas kashgarensis TaxID=3084920 RepID=UPI00321759A2